MTCRIAESSHHPGPPGRSFPAHRAFPLLLLPDRPFLVPPVPPKQLGTLAVLPSLCFPLSTLPLVVFLLLLSSFLLFLLLPPSFFSSLRFSPDY